MSLTEHKQDGETLQRIAVNLQKINSTLEHLVGVVEEVAVTIEKSQEPEDEMGVHLVKAIRDLVVTLGRQDQIKRAIRNDRDSR